MLSRAMGASPARFRLAATYQWSSARRRCGVFGSALSTTARLQQPAQPERAAASNDNSTGLQTAATEGGGKARGSWRARLLGAGLGATLFAGVGGSAYAQAFSPDRGLKTESQYLELVQSVSGSDSAQALITTDTMLSGDAPMGDDHLFTNLLKQEMVNDIHLFFDAKRKQFHGVIGLGSDVCGHPTIVHGGLTAAIIDETFGGLIFCLKRWKLLGPGPPFTVKLEVDYHKPLRANSMVVCTAELVEVDGRKVWMKATVVDSKSRIVYASGKALFVTPKIKFHEPWTLLAWGKAIAMFYGP